MPQSFWEVSGDDLEEFADRVDAPAIFPELIRRLLLETGLLRSISFRADGGTRLSGWDGLVDAQDGPIWVPRGLSAWETSVSGEKGTKIRDDFEKRSGNSLGLDPKSSTYVSVSCRRIGNKTELERELSTTRTFAAVRILDADDLSAWLSRAFATRSWFLRVIGRPLEGVRSLTDFIEDWSRRTSRPLPSHLALLGTDRQQASEMLSRWLAGAEQGGRPTPPLVVRSEERDDALVFVAAVVLSQHPALAQRSVVIDGSANFERLTAEKRLLCIVSFAGASEWVPRLKCPAILAEDRSEPSSVSNVRDGRIDLDPIPYGLLGSALEELLIPSAELVARQSAGRLTSLQRTLGYRQVARWIRPGEESALTSLLLAGSWESNNTADHSVLKRLGVRGPRAEDMAQRLIQEVDAPMRMLEPTFGRRAFAWSSPKIAWIDLGRFVTSHLLMTFFEIAREVLSETNPAYALPADQRFGAARLGATPKYSAALRGGLSETLVHLVLNAEAFPHLQQARADVDRFVSEILSPAWTRWASLADELQNLAEAAPRAFLNAVERSLRVDDGVGRLFHQETQWGSSPHVQLLWALEAVAWLPNLALKVVRILVDLNAVDPGGRLVNRPAESFAAILNPVRSCSSLNAEGRFECIQQTLSRGDDKSFLLILSLLKEQGILPTGQRPNHHHVVEERFATEEEHDFEVARIVAALVTAADHNTVLWASLVEHVGRSQRPELVGGPVLTALANLQPRLDDASGQFWAILRQSLSVQLSWFPDASHVRILDELYRSYEPADPILKNGWLFEPWSEIPGVEDHEHLEPERDRRRLAALDELLTPEPLSGVEHLWVAFDEQRRWGLVDALVASRFADDLERQLLNLTSPSETIQEFSIRFLPFRLSGRSLAEFCTILSELARRGRRREAVGLALRRAQSSEFWVAMEGLGLADDYWAQLTLIDNNLGEADVDRILREKLQRNLNEPAFALACQHAKRLTPKTALEMLDLGRGLLEEPLDVLAQHQIGELYARAASDANLDANRMVGVELAFFDILSRQRNDLIIFGELEEDPDLFAWLMSQIYRSEGAPRGEVDEQTQRIASRAYDVLDRWKTVPGRDLAGEAREERLLDWCTRALAATQASGRRSTGIINVGRVLARAPDADDGHWPCLAARRLLEQPLDTEDLARALCIAQRNRRGVTVRSKGQGGAQEWSLAETYRASAERLRAAWPQTADMLDRLAFGYEEDAGRFDRGERTERIQWGWDRPARSGPSAQERHVSDKADNRGAHIQELRLEGYGVISRLDELRLGPVTVLLGPNGSGKSSLLDALSFLKDTLVTGVEGAVSKRGGTSLPHQNSKGLIRIRAKFGFGSALEYELRMQVTGSQVRCGEELWAPSRSLRLVDRGLGAHEVEFRAITAEAPTVVTLRDRDTSALDRYFYENEKQPEIKRLVELLRSVRLYRPWVLERIKGETSVVDDQTELTDDGANLWSVLSNLAGQRDNPRFDHIESYMRRAFPSFRSIRPLPLKAGKVYAEFLMQDLGEPVEPLHASDGEMQLLLLLSALFGAPKDRPQLVLFDEPDTALHPAALCVFGEAVREATEEWNRQVLIATHSTVLLNQFENETVVAKRQDGHVSFGYTIDQAEIKDLLEQYPVGSLYEAELVGRQSASDSSQGEKGTSET